MTDDWDFSRPLSAPPPPSPAPGNASSNQSSFFAPGGTQAPTFGDSSGSPWGGGPDAAAPAPLSGQVSPPMVWLVAATVAALVGLGVAALNLSGGAVYIGAWVVSGPIAIGLLTIFVRADTVRQTAMFYSYPAWKPFAYRAVLVLCFLAVVAVALRIADWVGHL